VSVSAVAIRYARAVFELGVESGQLAVLTEQLREVSVAYRGSPELTRVFEDPLLEVADRTRVVDALSNRLGLSQTARNALRLLVARRRMNALGDIVEQLVLLADERAGVVRATVTSAAPLSQPQTVAIRDELERLTGKRVIVEHQQDASLLGGWVARVADHVVDASLRGRFAEIGHRLAESPLG
jgi:F-type H+-transporting ATPase subunit delta